MLTTEDEAKTKRCFQSFAACAGTSYSGGAGYALQTAPTACMGSACMAWRWAFSANLFTGVEKTKHGYCGLAGQAQDIVE